jgi:acetylornithine deacetylase/succinyl-diaminopimelate desuccinylase-like protein
MIRRLSLLLLALSTACATTVNRAYRDPGPRARSYGEAVDWSATASEATSLLSRYLRVDTQNPPGNETVGARFLAAILEREGIPSQIVEFAPGRGSLIARLKGSGKAGPLCLLSHIDVVPGDARDWEPGKGPLSGAIADG